MSDEPCITLPFGSSKENRGVSGHFGSLQLFKSILVAVFIGVVVVLFCFVFLGRCSICLCFWQEHTRDREVWRSTGAFWEVKVGNPAPQKGRAHRHCFF